MKKIKRTANSIYTNCLRINRHDIDGHEDDIAFAILAVFVFGTMWVSLIQL